MRDRTLSHAEYTRPLPPPSFSLLSQAEMVRRIEWVRAREGVDSGVFGPMPAPRPLPIGRISVPPWLKEAAS